MKPQANRSCFKKRLSPKARAVRVSTNYFFGASIENGRASGSAGPARIQSARATKQIRPSSAEAEFRRKISFPIRAICFQAWRGRERFHFDLKPSAANWLPRGRDLKYFSDSAREIFSPLRRCKSAVPIPASKNQRGVGIFRQLAPFAAVVIREKNKAAFVQTFQQNDARRRYSIFIRRRERGGVHVQIGFWPARFPPARTIFGIARSDSLPDPRAADRRAGYSRLMSASDIIFTSRGTPSGRASI